MQLIHSIHPFYDEHVFEIITFNSDGTKEKPNQKKDMFEKIT